MSERGVFAVDRGIWEHPSLASVDPFSPREAWIWLLSEAAWKPRRKRVGAVGLEIKRGEVAHSYRFLADRWRWSIGRVQRFLRRLEADTMIETNADAGALVVTICNYDRYQRVSLPDQGGGDMQPDTAAIRERYKLEDIEDIEVSSETTSLRNKRVASEKPTSGKSRKDEVVAILGQVVGPRRAEAIFEARELMKARLTPHAAGLLAKSLAKAPDPNAAADVMVERGWRGFKPEWLQERKRPKSNSELARDALERLASGKIDDEPYIDPFDIEARIARERCKPKSSEPEIAVHRDGQWVDATPFLRTAR